MENNSNSKYIRIAKYLSGFVLLAALCILLMDSFVDRVLGYIEFQMAVLAVPFVAIYSLLASVCYGFMPRSDILLINNMQNSRLDRNFICYLASKYVQDYKLPISKKEVFYSLYSIEHIDNPIFYQFTTNNASVFDETQLLVNVLTDSNYKPIHSIYKSFQACYFALSGCLGLAADGTHILEEISASINAFRKKLSSNYFQHTSSKPTQHDLKSISSLDLCNAYNQPSALLSLYYKDLLIEMASSDIGSSWEILDSYLPRDIFLSTMSVKTLYVEDPAVTNQTIFYNDRKYVPLTIWNIHRAILGNRCIYISINRVMSPYLSHKKVNQQIIYNNLIDVYLNSI